VRPVAIARYATVRAESVARTKSTSARGFITSRARVSPKTSAASESLCSSSDRPQAQRRHRDPELARRQIGIDVSTACATDFAPGLP
jgi:hypothetical protein